MCDSHIWTTPETTRAAASPLDEEERRPSLESKRVRRWPSQRGVVRPTRETLPFSSEQKCADPGACSIVASDQLEAEVAPLGVGAVGMDDLEQRVGRQR